MIITSTQHFKQPPQKIISLVPSQTELLYHLGLEQQVIGITKFCVHPHDWFKNKTRVGGTKNLNISRIQNLQPDLIIANKEENVKEQVEELTKDFNVWITDVNNMEDALAMIKDIGELTYKIRHAETLIGEIKYKFSELETKNYKLPTCYLIWQNPYMTVGGDTFINDMMKHCGLKNIFENKNRYPEINIDQLSTHNCQLILLSSEPYPFKQKHVDELQQLLPGKKIVLVDGEMFSWYGNRLLQAPGYFKSLLKSLEP